MTVVVASCEITICLYACSVRSDPGGKKGQGGRALGLGTVRKHGISVRSDPGGKKGQGGLALGLGPVRKHGMCDVTGTVANDDHHGNSYQMT